MATIRRRNFPTYLTVLTPTSAQETSLRGLPQALVDLLARECGLAWARTRVEAAREEVSAEKARLETTPGLLQSLSARAKRERQEGLKAALDTKAHYDAQIEKIDSLLLLLGKETVRWLDCCLKTRSPEYVAGLAVHDFPEDWSRFAYQFELNAKAFRMELADLRVRYRSEDPRGPRSAQHAQAIRRLLPVARLIEIDVEFLNRVFAEQARLRGERPPGGAKHPEYGWCELIEQLEGLPVATASDTVHELVTVGETFLATVVQDIRREQAVAAEKSGRRGRRAAASFLKVWWDRLKPLVERGLKLSGPEAIVAETEALLLDGEFAGRFNRHLTDSIVRNPVPQIAAGAPAAQAAGRDEEVRALRKRLEEELDEVSRTKAGLAKRERLLREGEQAFAEKREREQAEFDRARTALTAQEAEFAERVRTWTETSERERAEIEALRAEHAAREAFIDESEQRLLVKGQEQVERLAELEQREEDLMAARRELNELRRQLGLPVESLRTTPVDEFNE